MTLRPGKLRQTTEKKGQPEGSAVTGLTRKPGVAMQILYQQAAGRNNSNLTSLSASADDDEWELLLRISSHYCFITLHEHSFQLLLYCSFILIRYL